MSLDCRVYIKKKAAICLSTRQRQMVVLMASKTIFSLVCALFLIAYGYGEEGIGGESLWIEKLMSERRHQAPIKDPIKTIMTKDGDIFDCVDIYKQPALDHPLLKNHKIQMRPSYYTRSYSDNEVIGTETTSCPENTVPIMRINNLNASMVNTSGVMDATPLNVTRHNAGYESDQSAYYGAQAGFGVYGVPEVKPKQISAVFMSFSSGTSEHIAVGWHVQPALYGDTKTRLLELWTSDTGKIGCFDRFCPGFVQVHPRIAPGSIIDPPSVYGGDQYYITLSVFKDFKSGNWLLHKTDGGADVFIGYWPKELFGSLGDYAGQIVWSGFVSYPVGDRSPPMGSGHFPDEGRGKAAFLQEVKFIGPDRQVHDANDFDGSYSLKDNCYRVSGFGFEAGHDDEGCKFYFGGPAGCRG